MRKINTKYHIYMYISYHVAMPYFVAATFVFAVLFFDFVMFYLQSLRPMFVIVLFIVGFLIYNYLIHFVMIQSLDSLFQIVLYNP